MGMVDMGNESGITVSVSVLTQLVRYLDHLEADRTAIFRSAGVDPKILDRPDSRISLENYMAVEEEAARVTADPCLGLHMGEFAEPGRRNSSIPHRSTSCRFPDTVSNPPCRAVSGSCACSPVRR